MQITENPAKFVRSVIDRARKAVPPNRGNETARQAWSIGLGLTDDTEPEFLRAFASLRERYWTIRDRVERSGVKFERFATDLKPLTKALSGEALGKKWEHVHNEFHPSATRVLEYCADIIDRDPSAEAIEDSVLDELRSLVQEAINLALNLEDDRARAIFVQAIRRLEIAVNNYEAYGLEGLEEAAAQAFGWTFIWTSMEPEGGIASGSERKNLSKLGGTLSAILSTILQQIAVREGMNLLEAWFETLKKLGS